MIANELLPVELLPPGEWADIVDISGETGWVGRLGELGLRVGGRLQVVQPGNPCMLRVNGSCLCVRGECAVQILVQRLGERHDGEAL